MGFMGKIKQWMGIGGVKLVVQPQSPSMPVGGGTIAGRVEIDSKSDQVITKLTIKIVEHKITGRGNEKEHKEFVLGTKVIAADLAIKAGEPKSVEFDVPYAASQSMGDRLAAKGGVLGAMGKLGKFADNEKNDYKIHAHASVKGTAIGSNSKAQLQPVA